MTKPKTSRLVEERQLESLLVFKIVHQPPNGVLDRERMVDEIPILQSKLFVVVLFCSSLVR